MRVRNSISARTASLEQLRTEVVGDGRAAIGCSDSASTWRRPRAALAARASRAGQPSVLSGKLLDDGVRQPGPQPAGQGRRPRRRPWPARPGRSPAASTPAPASEQGRSTGSRLATATWEPGGRYVTSSASASSEARSVSRCASSRATRTGAGRAEMADSRRPMTERALTLRERDGTEDRRVQRLDAIKGRGQVAEEHDRVVVEVVDGQPGRLARPVGGPLREQRRLAIAGRRDDGDEPTVSCSPRRSQDPRRGTDPTTLRGTRSLATMRSLDGRAGAPAIGCLASLVRGVTGDPGPPRPASCGTADSLPAPASGRLAMRDACPGLLARSTCGCGSTDADRAPSDADEAAMRRPMLHSTLRAERPPWTHTAGPATGWGDATRERERAIDPARMSAGLRAGRGASRLPDPGLVLQRALADRLGRRLPDAAAGHRLRALHHGHVHARLVAHGHPGLGLAVDRRLVSSSTSRTGARRPRTASRSPVTRVRRRERSRQAGQRLDPRAASSAAGRPGGGLLT